MSNERIYVLGNEEIVLMLGLLGIEGEIIENEEKFSKIFKNLAENPSIGMVLIGIKLSEENADLLVNYKLSNRRPFIFYLPDVFKLDTEIEDVFSKRILKYINKIIK